MSDSRGSPTRRIRLRNFIVPLAILWTLANAAALVVITLQEQNSFRASAESEALAHFNKDQAFRFWGAAHGGVYVPIDERTPPNEHLSHLPERDIETSSGKKLTLMNPAYMVRQMMDDYTDLYGVAGRITSLKPLRSENAPDEWEQKALRAFEDGEEVYSEYTAIDGESFLRYMKPMVTQESCLKCHAHQGYKVGDIRGGVGVSFPLTPLKSFSHYNHIRTHAATISVIWLMGMLGLVITGGQLKRHVQSTNLANEQLAVNNEELKAANNEMENQYMVLSSANDKLRVAKRELAESDEFNRTIVDGSPVGISVRDRFGGLLMHNQAWQDIWGIPDDEIDTLISSEPASLKFDYRDTYLGALRDEVRRIYKHGGSLHLPAIQPGDHRPGTPAWVSQHFNAIMNSDGVVERVVVFTEDVSERKQAEEKLRQLNATLNSSNEELSSSNEELEAQYEELAAANDDLNLAQESLRESEAGFRSMFDSATDAIYVQDTSGCFLAVNQAAVDMYGFAQEEFIGNTPEMVSAPGKNNMEQVLEHVRKAFAGEPQRFNFWGIRKDVEVFPKIVRLSRGTYMGQAVIFAFAIDISEQKRTEDALKDSEERYKLLTSMTSDYAASILVDDNGSLTTEWIVGSFEEITGHSSQIGSPVSFDCTHPDDFEQHKLDIAQTLRNQRTTSEFRSLKPDGTYVWLLVSRQPIWDDAQQRVVRFIAVAQDITERKLIEETLSQKSAYLDSVLSSSKRFSIAVTDLDMKIFYYNPAAEHIFGYTAEEVIGKTVMEIHTKENVSHERFLQAIDIVREAGEYRFSVESVTEDGVRYVDSVVSGIQNSGGDLIGFVLMSENVTARKLAEEEKNQLEQQLRQTQKMEAIGTLAGGIAHDFNNILQAILGYTAMAIEDLPPDTEVHEDLNEVIKAGRRAKSLVAQILAYARHTEETRQPVDFGSIAKEALKLLRATIPTSIEIHQDIQTGHSVFADPVQLHQVMMNLCTNAMQAMEETGGKLDISIKPINVTTKKSPSIGGVTPGRYVELIVTDTGPGIPPDILDRVLDPFFTTKAPGVGTGMGLAVVQGIASACGGALSVESQLGNGASFRVLLPVTDAAADDSSFSAKDLPGGSESIMLVDDEEAVLTLTRMMLERLGYHVSCFTNSRIALTAFRQNPGAFDLVITDQTMPRPTGLSLAKEMLAIKPELPVFLCTGFSKTVPPERAREHGILEYLTKPYDQRDMAERIRRTLDGLAEETESQY